MQLSGDSSAGDSSAGDSSAGDSFLKLILS